MTDSMVPTEASTSLPGLALALRARTQRLHARAERTGIVRAMLTGNASRDGYALLLRNLLPAYQALEAGLERHRPSLPGLACPGMYRAAGIAADLTALCGPDWRDRIRLLPAGARYVYRVKLAAHGNGARLIAHAYARYLGDLSGGQVLRRLLARSLGLGPDSLSFLDFPAIADVSVFKADFRSALDQAGRMLGDTGEAVAEAAVAFRLNIAVAEAVQSAAERVTEST